MAEHTPGTDDLVRDLLARAGIAQPAIDAVFRIDALMQVWRRRITKKELGRIALDDLGIGLDLPQFDILVAIAAPDGEFADSGGDETMVLTVAERLGIDPSRSSRLIAELVAAGYAARAVSQADARRTIVRLTDRGAAVVAAVRAYKHLMLAGFLSEWSQEDIERFLPLFARFTSISDSLDDRRIRFAAEVGSLLAGIQNMR